MQFSARIAHHELFCLTRVQRAKMPWSFPQVKVSNCVTQPTDVAQQQATECEEEVKSQRPDGSEAEDDRKAKQVKFFFDADESWDCSRQHGRHVRVPPMDGAEWWQFPILEAGEYERSCLPESQAEVFKMNSSYSGAMPQVGCALSRWRPAVCPPRPVSGPTVRAGRRVVFECTRMDVLIRVLAAAHWSAICRDSWPCVVRDHFPPGP